MEDDFPEDPYPFQKHLGMERSAWSLDYARIELPLGAYLGNRQGLPHGGVHATLLDTAMGYAGTWTGSRAAAQMALTLSLNVQYLSRPQGQRLIAEGWRTGGGKSTFFAEGLIHDDAGELIAKGTGVFRYRKR